jgi:hypothetical protein
MFRTVAEIYEDPDIRSHANRFQDVCNDGGIEQCLEKAGHLGGLATESAVISYVESLPDYNFRQQDRPRAARLLGCLPTHILVRDLGMPLTAWTYGNDREHRATSLAEDLAEEGFDPDLLSKAKTLAMVENMLPRGNDILKHNRVIEAMLGAHEIVDLPGALQRSALPDVKLSPSRLDRYALHPLRATKGFWSDGLVNEWPGKEKLNARDGLRYKLWLDTPTGLGLFYKGVPQLEIGAVAHGDDELQVKQMQRVYGKYYDPANPKNGVTGLKAPRGLMPLDWQKLTVDIAAQVATQLHLENVGILAGENIPSRTAHIDEQKAVEAYDGAAARLTFNRDEQGNWHKPVVDLLA